MDIDDIIKKFKHKELRKFIPTLMEKPYNYVVEKGKTSGSAITIWGVKPKADEGTYCYYEDESERDLDYALLRVLLA
jgi:hypothetical protein